VVEGRTKSLSRIIKKDEATERSKSFDAFFADLHFVSHEKKDSYKDHVNKIKLEAQAEAENIVNEARKQAVIEQQSGFEEGLRQGLEHIKPLEALLGGLAEEIKLFKEQYPKLIEPAVVQMVMQICNKIIKDTLEKDREVVLRTVRHAFNELTDKEFIKIRVHKNDRAILQKFQGSLMERFHEIKKLEIVIDDSVDQGGCIIETNEGNIDATIKTQLNKMCHVIMSDSSVTPSEVLS